jgi:hydrogenase 3 maturation protease
VVSRLAALAVPGLQAIPGGTAPENRTAEIRRAAPAAVVIVDAAEMGEPPGAVRVIDPADIAGVSFSTHTLPLHIVVDYLRRELGCAAAVIGIQPASLAFDGPVSPEVAHAVEETVTALREALSP